ncbi:ABC transporter ATP-binding protein [Alkalihalobacillus sp. LMS39]|uniref:ABC transporter ATP-binding protein n=1 Tax=Alkalihalobacillus sp. LMS39 TaxID=2924032 RepID=UPI001FB3489B|nr:ABC transporter ATP-binding protein [Alkalihalobacillus sp. LMS39]UOE94581.1 ABC transporter ATP-binding protein [Alkalihalobacillus sp. LMS39]
MEVKQVSFSYKQKMNQLENINCQIEKGKITTIIGPNGSGKSTLLGVMSKNHRPKKGEVILDGRAISQYKPKEFAQKLAVVHQQNEAPEDMTVEKLTAYGRLPYKSIFSQETEEDKMAMEWALTCTKLQSKRHVKITELSGGERQRVWIAMSLAQQTPILFLDEPTTYLDLYYQYEILQLVKSLNQEYQITIVMVLHDINQAIKYSDHIIAMKQGQILLQGEPNDVITTVSMKDIYNVDVVVKKEPETGLYIVPIGI